MLRDVNTGPREETRASGWALETDGGTDPFGTEKNGSCETTQTSDLTHTSDVPVVFHLGEGYIHGDIIFSKSLLTITKTAWTETTGKSELSSTAEAEGMLSLTCSLVLFRQLEL